MAKDLESLRARVKSSGVSNKTLINAVRTQSPGPVRKVSQSQVVRENLTGGMTFGLAGPPDSPVSRFGETSGRAVGNVIRKTFGKDPIDTRVTERRPESSVLNTLVPDLAGFIIGGPGHLVRGVSNKVLAKATGRSAESLAKVGGSLAERLARGSVTQVTKSPVKKLIALKSAAEGAGGLAFGAAEGAVKGLRGEDLVRHTALTGGLFAAFGAAEIPMSAGFRILAKKWGKSSDELMAEISREAQLTKRDPADLIKEKVMTNVSGSEIKAEVLGLSPTTQVPKIVAPRKSTTKAPVGPSMTQAAKSLPKQAKVTAGPSPTKNPRTKVSLPETPIKVPLTPSEVEGLTKAAKLESPDQLSRVHLRKNLKVLSKDSMESYRKVVESEKGALVFQQKNQGGLSKAEYDSSLKSLNAELRRIRTAEKKVLVLRPTGETAEPVSLKGVAETDVSRALEGPIAPGTPHISLKDTTGASLEPGVSYEINYRLKSGESQVTLVKGSELMEILDSGRIGKTKILDITDISPTTNGVRLSSGLPIDPKSYDKQMSDFVDSTKKFMTESGILTKEGEEVIQRVSQSSADDALMGVNRWFQTPQHLFRKSHKLAEFTKDASLAEVRLAKNINEVLHKPFDPASPKRLVGWESLRKELRKRGGKDAVHELDDIVLGVDSMAGEARASGKTFKTPSHEGLTKMGYSDDAAWAYGKTRQLMDTSHRQLQLHERAMASTLKERLRLTRKQMKSATGESLKTLETEARVLVNRLKRTDIGYLEGYFPHRFIGGWRASVNGESIPQLYQSSQEALKSARQVVGKTTADIKVFPKFNDYSTLSGAALDRPQYWSLVNRLEKSLGVTEQDALNALKNVTRLKGRRRHFGSLMHRKGVAGFSDDVNEVMSIYLQQAQSYMQMDALKQRGMNLLEGLPQGSKTRDAFDKYLVDVLRQKQGLEKDLDALVMKMFDSPAFKSLDAVLGLGDNVPGLSRLTKSGRTTLRSDFPTRRMVNGTLAMVTHLKLGLGNAGAAVVNLSQVPLNVYPLLGAKYTMRGYGEFARASKATHRLLDRAGINVIQPKYEAGMMLDKSVWQRLSLGLFNKSETMNRAVAFLGKYHQSLDLGHTTGDAFRQGRDFAMQTQFIYGPSTNPEVARKLLARLPLQFRGFLIRELGFMTQLKGAEIPRFLGALTTMSGTLGLPGAFALDAVVESLTGRSYLDEFRAEWLREGGQIVEHDSTGKPQINTDITAREALTTVGLKGVPALLGVDFSQRVGFGDFIPVNGRDALTGAAISSVLKVHAIYDSTDDLPGAIASLGTTTRGALEMTRALHDSGNLRSLQTGKIRARDLSPSELILRTINIPVTKLAREQEATIFAQGKSDRELKTYAPLIRKWAIHTRNGRYDIADKVLAEVLRISRREGIDGDRINAGLRNALVGLELSPTEKIFKQKSKSIRQGLGAEVLR